jgi:DNA-binding protein HU-beta
MHKRSVALLRDEAQPGCLQAPACLDSPVRNEDDGYTRAFGDCAMTKDEFVEQVARRAGLSKRDASNAVEAFLDTIEGALKRGSEVKFSGFGKFSVSQRRARQGRDPATGERIHIQASRVPKFTAGAALTKTIRKSNPREAKMFADEAEFRDALLADSHARAESERLIEALSGADPRLVEAALNGEDIDAFREALGLTDAEFVEIARVLDRARQNALSHTSAAVPSS